MYKDVVKPSLDWLGALIILVLTSPLILLVIIALAFTNHGRFWFIQIRPGYHEKPFKIIKFKTMTDQRDQAGNLLPDNQRITLAGKLIRKFSLDEIPQLINVLRGEMSLVGPRPLLEEYIPLYNEEQRKRHHVRPGITGWAQVNGRNTITWQQKFAFDTWYVEHVSFWLDLRIVWLTAMKVIRTEGINSSKSETMEKFKGNLS